MHRGLQYAESDLGVHKVYQDADALAGRLDDAHEDLVKVIAERRDLDEKIEDRQMEILIVERGKASDLSQAAMDRRLKEKYHTDAKLIDLRTQRNVASSKASALELEADTLKYRIKVKVARMEELAGYFQYLAALKSEAKAPAATPALGGEANEASEA